MDAVGGSHPAVCCCRYDRDRYLFIFEEQYLTALRRRRKFALLDAVREIISRQRPARHPVHRHRQGRRLLAGAVPVRLPVRGDGPEPGRRPGGHQKSSSTSSSTAAAPRRLEKRTKVKSRVMANALGELMADASTGVTSWATSSPTWTAIGAAAGVCAIARKKRRAAPTSSSSRAATPPAIMVDRLRPAAGVPGRLSSPPQDGHAAGRQPAPCWWWWTPTGPSRWWRSICC